MIEVDIISKVVAKGTGKGVSMFGGGDSIDLSAYATLEYVLGNFVTLDTEQTILGKKNFTGGLLVNGSPIYYDADNKYWKLEGDLLVTGGVTMYADGTTSGGSSAYSTLGSLSNVDESIDASASVDRVLFQAAGSSEWITKPLSEIGGSVSGDYLPLSGGKLTGTLLTQAVVPSADNTYSFGYSNYRWAAGHFANLYVNGNIVWHSGNGGAGSGLDADTLDGLQYDSFFVKGTVNTYNHGISLGNYTAVNSDANAWNYAANVNLMLRASNNAMVFAVSGSQNDRRAMIQVGHATSNYAANTGSLYLNLLGGKVYIGTTEAATINSNVASATKLQTARTIWGQSFDGSGNVTGSLTIPNSEILQFKGTDGTAYNGMYMSANNNLLIGYGIAGIDRYTYLEGGTIVFRIGSSHTEKCRFDANGMIWASSVNCDIRTTDTSIYLRRAGADSNTILLGNAYFSPLAASTDLLKLGRYNARWNGVYLLAYGSTSVNTSGVVYCNDSGETVSLISVRGSNGALGVYAQGQIVIRPGCTKGTSGAVVTNSSIGATFDASGNLLMTGGITMYSDIRKKTKLQDVELSLKQIADAPLIEHFYNSDEQKTTHVGSIAQYWAGINDWFCKLDGEGYYTMEIQNAALASAISIARELTRYESKTDKKIRKMQQRIIELEDELEKLKRA